MSQLNLHTVLCVPKKEASKLLAITFLTDFQNSFTAVKRMKFPTKPSNIFHYTPYKYVLALPWKS